ncbi:MAG: hypothetical protein ABWX59_01170 [Microbacteriaceae bacterium]
MSEPGLAPTDDPPPVPPAALPPKTKRTWLWVAVAAAALLILVVVVIAFMVSSGTAASAPSPTAVATDETDEAEPAAEAETPNPTPTPDAAPGTFENPYPIGAPVTWSSETGQGLLTAQVRQMGQAEFEITTGAAESGVETPAAPEGMVNVFLEYTVTNLSPDQPYDAVTESGYWQVVDEDGNEYPVYARNIGDQNVLPVEPGASWEAHAIFQVPADATGLMILIYNAYIKL